MANPVRYVIYRLFLAKLRLDLNGGTLGIILRLIILFGLCSVLLATALLAAGHSHTTPPPSVYPSGFRGRP